MTRILATPLLFAGCIAAATAHSGHEVVPEAEYERARVLQAQGPSANRNVEGVNALGSVALDGEFDRAPDDRVLRAREITIGPGGVIGVHEHHRRPGVAYIIEGEIYEHRSDLDEPALRRAGDAAFERTGLVHWWENRSDAPVRALVVDIVPRDE